MAELQAIAQALSAVAPTKAIWKLAESDLIMLGNSSLPVTSNVKIVNWVPQNDLLGHPNVKVFFTQAGSNSFNEVCLQPSAQNAMLHQLHVQPLMHIDLQVSSIGTIDDGQATIATAEGSCWVSCKCCRAMPMCG